MYVIVPDMCLSKVKLESWFPSSATITSDRGFVQFEVCSIGCAGDDNIGED